MPMLTDSNDNLKSFIDTFTNLKMNIRQIERLNLIKENIKSNRGLRNQFEINYTGIETTHTTNIIFTLR